MNYKWKFGAWFSFGVLVCTSLVVNAQSAGVRGDYQYPSEKGSGAVQLGTSPVWATPWARVGYGYDSNLTLSNSDEIDSYGWQARAGAMAEARGERSSFKFSIDANDVNYTDSREDSYTDIFTSTSIDVALSERSFVRGYWNYNRGHDGRGATDRGIGDSVDKWTISKPGILFGYGAQGAQGRIELYANQAMKRYRNNYEVTEQSENDTTEYGGAFYWRVAPRTSLVVEVRGTDIEFLIASPNSSRETRYLGGVTWEATAATSGTIKVGRMERRPDGAPSYNTTSWEALINWAPRTYSKFDIYSSRYTQEATGLGNFIVSDTTGINWAHSWSSFVSTTANARFQKDKYQGFDRNDDIITLGLGATYKFRPWISFGAEYRYVTRDSSIKSNEYDKDIWLLSAEVSM